MVYVSAEWIMHVPLHTQLQSDLTLTNARQRRPCLFCRVPDEGVSICGSVCAMKVQGKVVLAVAIVACWVEATEVSE